MVNSGLIFWRISAIPMSVARHCPRRSKPIGQSSQQLVGNPAGFRFPEPFLPRFWQKFAIGTALVKG
jgi:hypothetical protein